MADGQETKEVTVEKIREKSEDRTQRTGGKEENRDKGARGSL